MAELYRWAAALRSESAFNHQIGQGPQDVCAFEATGLQGLQRYEDDLQNGLLEADYIVIEMARAILGENWMREYVDKANAGGIERVLV